MSAKERLQGLRTTLEGKGVRDVKFFVDPCCPTLTKLSNDVADMLDAVVKGHYVDLPPAGDMPQLRAAI